MKTDRELFLYELEGHGYTFENMKWLGNCFENDILNMAYEMWCASSSREGYKLVPCEPSEEMVEKGDYQSMYGDSSALSIYKAMIGVVE